MASWECNFETNDTVQMRYSVLCKVCISDYDCGALDVESGLTNKMLAFSSMGTDPLEAVSPNCSMNMLPVLQLKHGYTKVHSLRN